MDHYDIIAKAVDVDTEQLRGPSPDRRRTMLQHLLERRFHWETHIETKTLPLMELYVAKEGIKFT